MRTNHSANFYALGLGALMLTLSLLGLARPAWSDYEQMRGEVAQFHAFMREHPKVSTAIQGNPQLVNDLKFLNKHDDLKKFLRRRPALQREIAEHPRRVFGRYYIDDRRDHFDNRREHRWDYDHRDQRDRRDRRDYRDYR